MILASSSCHAEKRRIPEEWEYEIQDGPVVWEKVRSFTRYVHKLIFHDLSYPRVTSFHDASSNDE